MNYRNHNHHIGSNDRRFFIYARKSTDDSDRQIRSLDDQLAEARELANRMSAPVIDILVEKQSAKKPGRPVFNDMLARMEKGEANGIIAWHPDRLARNMLDGGRIIHLVDTGVIKEMLFPTVQFDVTSQGKLNLAMLFGMSKYYVDNLAENIKRGQRNKLKNGIWPMVAPIGYLNDRKAKLIIPDPERAPLVRKAFELHVAGTFTIDRLCKAVNELGLTNRKGNLLSRSQYHRILQNPLYCGIIRYGGGEYEAKHQAIVPKDLFDQVQKVIQTKSKPKDPNLKPFIYRGMFRCGECGCMITTETQKRHNYLHCTKRVKRDCSQPYVREEEISRQISEALQWITIPDDWAEWMLQELEKQAAAYQTAHAEQVTRLKSKFDTCHEKLKKLLGLYLDESLTQDEYRLAKAEIIAEKLKLNEELTASQAGEHLWFEPCIRFVKTHTHSHFMTTHVGKIEEERETLKNTGSNLRIEQKVLTVEFQEPWKTLEKYGRLAHRTPARLTPARGFVAKPTPFSQKRRGRDSNPRKAVANRGLAFFRGRLSRLSPKAGVFAWRQRRSRMSGRCLCWTYADVTGGADARTPLVLCCGRADPGGGGDPSGQADPLPQGPD